MKRATEARPCDGYRIWLRYADGVEGAQDAEFGVVVRRGIAKRRYLNVHGLCVSRSPSLVDAELSRGNHARIL